jgi:hypothetical protein
VIISLKRATSDSQRFLQAQDSPTSETQSGHNARPQDLHTATASELRCVKHFMMLTDISHITPSQPGPYLYFLQFTPALKAFATIS